jgi:hypothetical protein
MDWSVLRAEKVADARYEALSDALVAAPSRDAKDVVAKLQFMRKLEDLDKLGSSVVAGLIQDLSKQVASRR